MDDRVTRPGRKAAVRVFVSQDHLWKASASLILDRLSSRLAEGNTSSLVLSGGGTPRRVYELLAEQAANISWEKVHLFWGDERCVPPDSPESNYRMARESLLSRIAVPERNVHRMKGELPPEEGAADYEAELKRHFGEAGPPSFDLLLLGLGADGHTASLFPGSPALREERAWATTSMQDGRRRITLTLGALNAAKEILFIVTGADKAPAVAATLEGDDAPLRYPAQNVRPPGGRVTWHLDAAAASLLRTR